MMNCFSVSYIFIIYSHSWQDDIMKRKKIEKKTSLCLSVQRTQSFTLLRLIVLVSQLECFPA